MASTPSHPAEDLLDQLPGSREIQAARIGKFLVSAAELHSSLTLILHFYLLEDFEPHHRSPVSSIIILSRFMFTCESSMNLTTTDNISPVFFVHLSSPESQALPVIDRVMSIDVAYY